MEVVDVLHLSQHMSPFPLLPRFTLSYAFILGVGRAKNEYACYVPDHHEEPIKCILSEVKSGIRDLGWKPGGPYVYSEHSLAVDENDNPVYKSKSCKIKSDSKTGSMKLAETCYLNGVNEFIFKRGAAHYEIEPKGAADSDSLPVRERYFTKVEVKDIFDRALCKEGNKLDVIAQYVSDSSNEQKWRANFTLGAKKPFCGGKRELNVKLARTVNGELTRYTAGYTDSPRIRFGYTLDGFLIQLKSKLNKGQYALLIYTNDETYLLFNKDKMPDTQRARSEPSAPPQRLSFNDRIPPPPSYNEVLAGAAELPSYHSLYPNGPTDNV